MLLPAPALLSTITGWPSFLKSRSARARAKMSVACPVGKGTTRRIGRSGQAACAAVANTAAREHARASRASVRRYWECLCIHALSPQGLHGNGGPGAKRNLLL